MIPPAWNHSIPYYGSYIMLSIILMLNKYTAEGQFIQVYRG